MIGTLVDLLGSFYVDNDLTQFETIARTLHASVPEDLVSLQFLGLACYRTGRVDEAVSIFDKVLRRRTKLLADDSVEDAHTIAGDDSCAAVCYQEATRHNPRLAKAWYDLGAVLLKLKKSELAMSAFRNFLTAQPVPAVAVAALQQLGLSPDALRAAEPALAG